MILVLLLLKQDFEQPHRIVCQGKAAEAGCVLGLVLLHDLCDPGHGVPYGQRLHRKVDAVPFQPQYLAAAQAIQRGDIDDRVEAFVFDGSQQVSHLRFGVERAGKLCSVRHDHQIGGVCLDDRAKKVTIDGEPVNLTKTEYAILKFLMEHPNTVYAPKDIYRAVWEDAPFGQEGTVAVHIRHLREKIEADPSEPRYIKVVWGQGYMFGKE